MFWWWTLVWTVLLGAGCAGLFQFWCQRSQSGLLLALAFALLSQGQISWSDVPGLSWLGITAAFSLSWKYATRPRSPGRVDVTDWERWGFLLCLLLLPSNPGWLAPHWILLNRRQRLVPPSLHERLPIHLCSLLLCQILLRQALGGGVDAPARLAIWTACLAVIAALYVKPGLAKLKAGHHWWSWPTRVGLHYQVIGSYQWGWWAGWSEEQIARLAARLRPFNPLLAGLVVVLELAALGFPLHPTFALCELLALMSFHLAYFALTGAFFWENLLLGLATCAAIPHLPAEFFSLPSALLFLASVAVSMRVFQTSELTWWELPLVQRVYTEVVVQGQVYCLTHAWLDPLERRFYVGFEEVSPYQLWTHNLSHTDLSQSEVEQILLKRACLQIPERPLPAGQADQLRQTLEEILPGLEQSREVVPGWLKAPRSYLSPGSRGACYQGQGPIEEIRICYREVHFDEVSLKIARQQTVLAWVRQLDPSKPGVPLLTSKLQAP